MDPHSMTEVLPIRFTSTSLLFWTTKLSFWISSIMLMQMSEARLHTNLSTKERSDFDYLSRLAPDWSLIVKVTSILEVDHGMGCGFGSAAVTFNIDPSHRRLSPLATKSLKFLVLANLIALWRMRWLSLSSRLILALWVFQDLAFSIAALDLYYWAIAYSTGAFYVQRSFWRS